MRTQKKYKCPFCVNKVYTNYGGWEAHITNMHMSQIPKEWTPSRYLYYMQTGMTEGHCVECKNPTEWNEGSQKYERYCKNPACKQKYIRTAKSRMVDVYGQEYILTNPDVQRRMQAAKHISGKVKFHDGGYVEYVGTYERDFLEMLNTYGFSSNDIIGPSPNTYYYNYDNPKEPEKKGEHFYIPDFYIPSLNLEIEIKTQLNTHHKIQDVDKVKEAQKDEMMERLVKLNKINYLKLSDKDYTSFFKFMLDIRSLDTKEDILRKKATSTPALEEYTFGKELELDIGYEQIIPDTSDFIAIPIDVDNYEKYPQILENVKEYVFMDGYEIYLIKKELISSYIGYLIFEKESKKSVSINLLPEYASTRLFPALCKFARDKFGVKIKYEDEIAQESAIKITYLDEGGDTIIELEKGVKPYGIDTMLKNISLNIWVFSDPHAMTYNAANILRTRNILTNINQTVPENDHLLILGDLGGKRGFESLEETKAFVSQIKCKNKYLVFGNHDKYEMKDYISMGFKMVTDKFQWKNLVFSHVPIKVKPGEINIHGHNHGVECYINDGVSPDDHIDVYNEEMIPRQLRVLLNRDGSPIKVGDTISTQRKPVFNPDYEPAIESRSSSPLGDPLDIYKGFWKEQLFTAERAENLVGRRDRPRVSPYITLSRVIVDDKRGMISIQHINALLLINRMEETYDEAKLEYLFDLMYEKKDIVRYLRRKIPRRKMKITALESPVFFAMELHVLFMDLYNKYRSAMYLEIAKAIYNKTWLSKADHAQVTPIDLTGLEQLTGNYTLKDHQLEFIRNYPELKARLNLNGYILAFDQGLGKTLTATALSLCLHMERVYIVCPNSLKAVWKQELTGYLKRYASNKITAEREILICNKEFTKKDLEYYKDARYIITNIESIPSMYQYIVRGRKSMIIVDEMHNFRNTNGKRTDELLELKRRINPSDILLMSGTPMKASPNELVPSLQMIDPLFTDKCAEMYNRAFDLSNTLAMSVVRKRFGYIMHRRTKEILNLPNKQVQDLHLHIKDPTPYYMSTIKEETYFYFKKYYSEELEKNLEYRDEFIRLVKYYTSASQEQTNFYLRWVVRTVNTGKDMQMHDLDEIAVKTYLDTYVKPNIKRAEDYKKLQELEGKFLSMINSCMGRGIGLVYPPKRAECYTSLFMENREVIEEMITNATKKTVIFSQFLNTINSISNMLTADGFKNVKIVGGTNNRMELIDQFKHDEETMVLLATSQTLGTGVTLTEANQMFFFGPPWRSTDFDQCCDRIYRIGQTTDVNIYNVVLQSDEYNITDRMSKILNWSGDMFGAAITEAQLEGSMDSILELSQGYGDDIAVENTLFSQKPKYFNMEKLDTVPGKNLLFITGLSGGGKTTISRQIRDKYGEDAILVPIDAFEGNAGLFERTDDELNSEGLVLIKDYLRSNYGGQHKFFDEPTQEDLKKFAADEIKFINYLRKYAQSTNKIVIVEGIQLLDVPEVIDKNDPLILVGTSVLTATFRGVKRDTKNEKEDGKKVTIRRITRDFANKYRTNDVLDTALSRVKKDMKANEKEEKKQQKLIIKNA